MGRCVVGHLVSEVAEDRSAFIFRLRGLLDAPDEGKNMGNCKSNDKESHPTRLEILAAQH